MTDLDVVLAEIQSLKKTQDQHGTALERLADAYTRMAVQSEQINSLQAQNTALWRKYDGLVGADGIITKVREHQGQCPKHEMHRTFRWLWAALALEATVLLTVISQIMKAAQ